MGKAQSKRSVDITTENKDGVAAPEGESGKVGKIEDVDQKPQLNGEATKEPESGATEEKKDEAENEKDAATEKSEQPAEAAPVAEVAASDAKEIEKPAENGDEATENADTTTGTLDESKDGVENAGDDTNASTPTDSAKKPKKEKSKKRFLSFRSFSFSKKDKTKPKKEEAAATTNGECEKVPEEGTEDAAAAAPSEEKAEDAAPVTNGTSEEIKTNGEQAPVATPEESVTPPSNGESKPIVEAAKETVEEVIVAASKSVDEKLNSVAKPEANGVGNDTEKLNGDHKTIEEIATSPEKLEKLAAANPPPSTEVVAAE